MTSTDAPVLVTGATGAVGRLLVAELLARGVRVRALSRNPDRAPLPAGVEVIGGDLTDPTSLPEALFRDVRRAFVFPAEGGVDGFVAQARAGGVELLVLLSSLAAAGEHERDLRSPSYHHHLAAEQAVTGSGATWTILRPGTFANNLLAWKHTLSQGDTVFGPYAQSAQAPIHEADVAAVAATALTADAHVDATYAMTGPQALTRVEQLETIGAATGRDLTFQESSPESFAETMGQYMPAAIVQMLLDYWSDTVEAPDRVRPGVEEATGRPARTHAAWAADHAADFARAPTT